MAATSWNCHVNICSPVPMPPNVPFISLSTLIPPNQVQIIQNYQSHRYISIHTHIYIYIYIYIFTKRYGLSLVPMGRVFGSSDSDELLQNLVESLISMCCTAPRVSNRLILPLLSYKFLILRDVIWFFPYWFAAVTKENMCTSFADVTCVRRKKQYSCRVSMPQQICWLEAMDVMFVFLQVVSNWLT